MAISARYVLMADDFRREDNGKLIIIGLYTPDMVVPQIPVVLPTLTFFMNLESDRPGNFGFRVRVVHQETGNVVQQAQAMGMVAYRSTLLDFTASAWRSTGSVIRLFQRSTCN